MEGRIKQGYWKDDEIFKNKLLFYSDFTILAKYFKVNLDNFQKPWILPHFSAVYLWIWNMKWNIIIMCPSLHTVFPKLIQLLQTFIDVQACPFFWEQKKRKKTN